MSGIFNKRRKTFSLNRPTGPIQSLSWNVCELCVVCAMDAFFSKTFFCWPVSLGMVALVPTQPFSAVFNCFQPFSAVFSRFKKIQAFSTIFNPFQAFSSVFSCFQPFSTILSAFNRFLPLSTVFICFQLYPTIFSRFQAFFYCFQLF